MNGNCLNLTEKMQVAVTTKKIVHKLLLRKLLLLV